MRPKRRGPTAKCSFGRRLKTSAPGLLLGLLADGATVDEDEVGRVLRRDLLMAGRDEQRRDRLRVAHVHLAAVGVDEKLHFLFRTTSVSKRAVRGNMLNHWTDATSYDRVISRRSRTSVAGSQLT